MAGPAIDGTAGWEVREVGEADYNAYLIAGFRRLDDIEAENIDVMIGTQRRYTQRSRRFDAARMEAPIEGVADGDNAAFTFSGPFTAVCRNGKVANPLGTAAGNTFTFDTAPESGDEITALVGVA